MQDVHVDSRVIRTKRLLRQGLTSLLQQKNLGKITVRELTEYVHINRGTFYLHYKDVYDLAEQIEQELLDGFEEVVSPYTLSDLRTHPYKVFSDICSFLYANREICAALLSDNGDMHFILNLRKFLHQKCMQDIIECYHLSDLEGYNYVYSYFESGTVGIIRYWLEHPEDDKTPDEIAALIDSLFSHGASALLAN